jgi:excisionase family DNA binding protein
MERLLSVKELAALIGLSRRTIYGLAERREIPVQRVRRRLMFSPSQIERWLGPMSVTVQVVDTRRRSVRKGGKS